MDHAVLLDFGSTFTKITVADLKNGSILLTGKTPSTVHTDAMEGMNRCLEQARRVLTKAQLEDALTLASSSAAGGLKMAVVGLTRGLSLTAGRDAVFGAGAKVLGSFYGPLKDADIERLEQLDLEIILFCGGYENGNETMVLENAERLARSNLHVPILYSGNKKAAARVRQLMLLGQKECFLIENILPAIGVLNTEPSQKAVRELFMQRIANMKGLSEVKKRLKGPILPTPAAVLQAGELLSLGTTKQPGMGDILMVDIGGATTDVYSYLVNQAADGAQLVGIEEPYAKRTVEGDMGMRESAICLLEAVDASLPAADAGISEDIFRQALHRRAEDIRFLPDTEPEKRIDHTIACWAAKISARRHAGTLEEVYRGEYKKLQRGKNLSGAKRIIGTGGVLVNSPRPEDILNHVCKRPGKETDLLLPTQLETYLDSQYVLYAAGLLRDQDEEAAMALLKCSIKQTQTTERRNGNGYTHEAAL